VQAKINRDLKSQHTDLIEKDIAFFAAKLDELKK
jgi:hypothetical protein